MKKALVIILVGILANFANAGLSFSGPMLINVGETVQMSLDTTGGDIIEGFVWVDYPNYSGQLSNPSPGSCYIIDTSYLPHAFGVSTTPEDCALDAGPVVTFDFTTAACAQIGDTYYLQFLDSGFGIVFSQSITIGGLLGYALEVTSPDGGETLQAGTTHTITWANNGVFSDVKLEYSTNNGAGWTVITASTANDEQYDWTVPEITSSQCLVRVSDVSDACVNDESGGAFNIYVCEISTPADTDGDCEVGVADLSAVAADWLRNGNPFEAGFSEAPEGMVFIPNGEFEMGDHAGGGDADELPLHTVYLDAFYISKNEITNQQYCDYLNIADTASQIKVENGIVYAIDDSSNSFPYLSTTSASSGAPNYSEYSQIEYSGGPFSAITRDSQSMADHPVINVSWDGAKAYCDHYGLRLPTEAEWEYAARGGAYYYKYPWGTDVINQTLANYNDGGFANPHGLTGLPFTSSAGYYGPQGGYGLCDMAGNVYEWCSDWYDSGYYSSSPTNNPTGPASGTMHILRGGTWGFDGTQCRVSYRSATTEIWGNTLGFRVVMDLD